MRTFLSMFILLSLGACVQDQGDIGSSSVDSGSTTGGTVTPPSATSTDPLYVYQWHLKNSGQDVLSYVSATIDSTPTSGIDLNVENIHDDGDGFTGQGVRIAVSDTGVDYTHPDLDGNELAGEHRNYAPLDPLRWDDATAEGYPSGNQPHGTAVTGLIAMEGWNDIGGRGVAPNASYAAFKFIIDYASFDHLSSNEAKNLHQLNGDFDIFNFSYGYDQCQFIDDYDDDHIDALKAGVTNLRGGLGTLYVQAAGNSFNEGFACFGNVNSTASQAVPYKVNVAAVNAAGVKASYSTPGSGVWVSGFGGEGTFDIDTDNSDAIYVYRYFPAMYTTDIQDCSSGMSIRDISQRIQNAFNYGPTTSLNMGCNYTNVMNGTSSAAPTVSGVIALMLEAKSTLTWRDVKYILAVTARKIDYDNNSDGFNDNEVLPHPIESLTGYAGVDYFVDLGYAYDYKWVDNNATVPVSFSNWYGFGLVDADAAVTMATSWAPGTLGTYVRTESALGVWLNVQTADTAIVTDNDLTASTDSTIVVATNYVIEAVQVKVSTDHLYPQDLAIHLVSPSGTEHRLAMVNSGILASGTGDYYFLANGFLNEESAGTWTLKVYDGFLGDTGKITEWAINIHGHTP